MMLGTTLLEEIKILRSPNRYNKEHEKFYIIPQQRLFMNLLLCSENLKICFLTLLL